MPWILLIHRLLRKGLKPRSGMIGVPAFALFNQVIRSWFCCLCRGSHCMLSIRAPIRWSSSLARLIMSFLLRITVRPNEFAMLTCLRPIMSETPS